MGELLKQDKILRFVHIVIQILLEMFIRVPNNIFMHRSRCLVLHRSTYRMALCFEDVSPTFLVAKP